MEETGHFQTIQDAEKVTSKKKKNPLRNQERHLSFLKGNNGDMEETGYFQTIQDAENLHDSLV